MAQSSEANFKVVAENRKARFNYEIGETFDAGLALTGTEVKSLRTGKATIAESYAHVDRKGEAWLVNATIPEYEAGNRFNHEPKRLRKLLLKQRELAKLAQAIEREGMTIVPLRIYFNDRGRAKLRIALARGKKLHDKREVEKKRDWSREKGRLLRDKGKHSIYVNPGASKRGLLSRRQFAMSRPSRLEIPMSRGQADALSDNLAACGSPGRRGGGDKRRG